MECRRAGCRRCPGSARRVRVRPTPACPGTGSTCWTCPRARTRGRLHPAGARQGDPQGAERTVFVSSMEQIGTGRYREDEGDAFLPPGVRLSSEDFAGAHAGAVFGNSVGPCSSPSDERRTCHGGHPCGRGPVAPGRRSRHPTALTCSPDRVTAELYVAHAADNPRLHPVRHRRGGRAAPDRTPRAAYPQPLVARRRAMVPMSVPSVSSAAYGIRGYRWNPVVPRPAVSRYDPGGKGRSQGRCAGRLSTSSAAGRLPRPRSAGSAGPCRTVVAAAGRPRWSPRATVPGSTPIRPGSPRTSPGQDARPAPGRRSRGPEPLTPRRADVRHRAPSNTGRPLVGEPGVGVCLAYTHG